MGKWVIDASHSCASFSIRHMMVANTSGMFSQMSGVIRFDPPDLSGLAIELGIDVASLTTGYLKRDEHLMSEDFFDVEKHPKIIFRSATVEVLGEKRARVTGPLTMHGITRPVTAEIEYFGPVKSPFGGEITVGFQAKTSINREDFGLTWNEVMEGGGVVVGKEVQITVEVEADLETS